MTIICSFLIICCFIFIMAGSSRALDFHKEITEHRRLETLGINRTEDIRELQEALTGTIVVMAFLAGLIAFFSVIIYNT